MKYGFLLSLILTVGVTSVLVAQVEKKDWLLGGSVGFDIGNSGSNSLNSATSNANFSPHIGYAIGKNSVMGLNLGLDYATTNIPSNILALGGYLFYKKYLPIKNRFGWYLMGEAGMAWSEEKVENYDNLGNKSTTVFNYLTYGLAFTPGLYYQISPGILLNVDAGLLSYSYTNGGDGQWTSDLQFGFLKNFAFGIDFVLGRSPKN